MDIGPSMPLRLEKPDSIDLKTAARYFGARGETDAATRALLEKCAVPLLAAATPRAVWLEAGTDSLTRAGILQGEDVYRHLKGCDTALLLAVTLGPGVDGQIRRAGVGDIAAGVASDALGSALAEQTADAAEAELRQLAAAEGTYLTGRFSPGSGVCPGRTGGGRRGSRAAAVGRPAGPVSHRPLFAGVRRLAHRGAAAGGGGAGHRPPRGALRDRQRPDDPAQEHHGSAGGQ